MLQQISYVKNIGRFYDVSIKGSSSSDPSFKKFNLIFADNGTGKSTISTVLKSLWQNDPQRLIEKKTIGANDESTIILQIKDKTYTFKNGQWNQRPDIAIEIFDEEFIEKNVLLPSGVELKNRRELFKYIVLGEDNVTKTEKVNGLNKYNNGDLKNKIQVLESNLKHEANIKDIKILDNVTKLDNSAFQTKKSRVEKNDKIIKNVAQIKKEKKLDKITNFKEISYKELVLVNLNTLEVAAEYKAHVQTHNEWIKDGMAILQSKNQESCPFCFQSIKKNDAIATYKTFFSEEYESLRNKVNNQITFVENIYSDAVIENVINIVKHNSERCDFWHKMDEKIPEFIELGVSLEKIINAFKVSLKNLLKRKKTNLLEIISPNEDELQGLCQEEKFRTSITNYNILIEELNGKIETLKDNAQDIDELNIRNEKDRTAIICNDVRYYNKKNAAIYSELESHRKQQKGNEETIKKLRKEIDQASSTILEKYEKSINKELENFGVEFSIEGIKRKSDSSRTEGVYFNIRLKGASFDPNGSGDNPYKLSNTLSSGDKSTLAFAFFIAKYRERDISNQIFLFDDPITSLDFFRKTQTKNVILRFLEKSLQVIVLTHSMEFAKLFKAQKNGRFIQIKKNNLISGLSCIPYNKFSDMIIEKHAYNSDLIQEYISDSSSVDRLKVMKSVRPYVETTIRTYRDDFISLSLGKMIEKLKKEGNICKEYIEKLKNINDIITPESSHGSVEIDEDDYKNISDTELMHVCKEAIQISAPLII